MIFNRIFIAAFLLMSLAGCEKDNFTDPNDPRYDSSPDIVSLNLEQTYQTIHHFGASGGFQDQWVGMWPDASREPVAELLFSSEMDGEGNPKGIGLSMWRVNIGDGSRDQANNGFLSSSWFRETESFLLEDGTYDWNQQAGVQWFVQKASEYGVPYFTAWATTPPYFMTDNGYVFRTDGVSGFNAPEANYEAYADFLAEVMLHYESQGYNFEVVAPFNETQYEWAFQVGEASQSGTKALNSEVTAATKIINAKFEEKNVNAKIMLPEAAQLQYLYEGNTDDTKGQLSAFFSQGSPYYLGDLSRVSNHIAGHSYFTNNSAEQSVQTRKSLRSALEGYSGLDYWQTEYSILGTAYQQNKDVSTLEEIDYALWVSKIIHNDLVFGNATGWSFWTALNQSTYGDHPYRFNLILYGTNVNNQTQSDGTFEDVKNLWALGNYSRFVRPGFIRFEVVDSAFENKESEVNNLMSSGFKSPDGNTIVLVFVNNQNEDRLIAFGENENLAGYNVEMFVTSKEKDLEKTAVAADNIIIPAKSITTIQATR